MEEIEGRIELSGNLGRQAAEALQLELRRLARRHGVTIKATKVEGVHDRQEDRDGR